MVVPLLAGIGGIAGGTIARSIAGNQREDAFNAANNVRQGELTAINGQRDAQGNLLTGATENLQAQRAGLLNEAIQKMGNQGQNIAVGTQQGSDAIRQGIMDMLANSGATTDQLAPQQFTPQAQAQAGIQGQEAPITQLLNDLSANQMGTVTGQRMTQDTGRTFDQGGQDIQRLLDAYTRENTGQRAQLSLDDLLSQIKLQQATQRAGNKGGILDSFGQLSQQVGGSFLGGI